ncbi:MAG TPA: hypothetical protein DDY93_09630 [Dehalococcoidia bacterium]|nr:hypothetical protein [Dehalococcoidia bacterium]
MRLCGHALASQLIVLGPLASARFHEPGTNTAVPITVPTAVTATSIRIRIVIDMFIIAPHSLYGWPIESRHVLLNLIESKLAPDETLAPTPVTA